MAEAGILLRLDRNHGAEADGGSKHVSRQLLHDRGSSLLSTVLAGKETRVGEHSGSTTPAAVNPN
jgi:hypothetical protein